MRVNPKIVGQGVRWDHGRLSILGYLGRHVGDLKDIVRSDREMEVSRVIRQKERDFLAAFCFDPVADITIDRLDNMETSVIMYGIDGDRMMELGMELTGSPGFETRPPSLRSDFVRTITRESFAVESLTYDAVAMVSSITGRDFASLWASPRYAHFLNKYQDKPSRESISIALKRFGLPLDKI